jgi:Haem-binding domain
MGIMNRACMDCHSYETRWPVYSRIASVSWWLINNVNDGRDTLNLSEWTQYKSSFATATLGSMAMVVNRGAMPLDSYKKFHPEARLSHEERKIFYDWASAERQRECENTNLNHSHTQ